jgi:acetylornithine aminotransferase
MNLFNVYPINDIEIARGEGSLVYDREGTEYLDMYGGHAVISIGHGHPHYIARIKEQLDKLGFYSNSVRIPIQNQLAEKLGQVSGYDDYNLFIVNSGAEANENAIKLASFYNGRKKVVAFKKSFHGRTSLAVAVTDNPGIVAPVNETDNVIFMPWNDSSALKELFAQQGELISSVIIEGIQGVGGIYEAHPEFLRTIRSLCDSHNAVFIADSVQCGYGRTGQFFAHDVSGVKADIYSMAKGMGNGFPIGGIAISPKFQARHGMLGTTFGGNHLACAAALAVLEVMEEDKLMDHAKEAGNFMIAELKKFPEVLEVRGRGLMIGIELPADMGHVRKNLLWKERIFTGFANPNVIRLLPALNLSMAHAERFLSGFEKSLRS